MADLIDRDAALNMELTVECGLDELEPLMRGMNLVFQHIKELPSAHDKIMELACDLCKWPGEYKDPDDLWRERCDTCTLLEYLEGIND